ncbi:MAG: glycerophosphodiester phosphodiesterase family protein [Devosia sp.]
MGAGYGVEVDVRLTGDGGLIVHHDASLQRTTHADGPVSAKTLEELRQVTVRGSDETLASLADLFALTAGRAPLFLDLKSPHGMERKAQMAAAVGRALGQYGGATALMTFDPDLLDLLRRTVTATPIGILAGGESKGPSLVTRFGRDFLLHTLRTKPDFVGYYSPALPHIAPQLSRRKRPVLAWTVRSAMEAERLARHVDQIIFEGFRP